MSKDAPEVGDIWQSVESGVTFILTAKDKYFDNMWYSMANDGRTRKIDVSNHFFETSRYLGKSKANIEQLFEVEDNGRCIEDNTPHAESTVLFKDLEDKE